MSESEIKRRQDYKRNRKRWIIVQAIAIALAVIVALGSFFTYDSMNRTYYIEYTESGNADYKVQYKENNFFDTEWVESGNSYVSSLIKGISADFAYSINMDTANVGFNYTYDVVAQLIVADKFTGDHIYEPTEVLVPTVTEKVEGADSVKINKNVFIDYAKYNTTAQSFVDVYGLKNATSSLAVTMNVHVLSSCDEFEENNSNVYAVAVNIPLGADNFSITTSTSVADGESKVLACSGTVNQNVFLNASVSAAAVALALICILTVFVYATRNDDVNYTIKVQKLVRAYRSYIQQINGEFDTATYQTVSIKTFVEMLGIRDTIQSPILMSENRDQTKTQFLIPTNTKILYVFEIRVDNYDELYAKIAEERVKESEGYDVSDFESTATEEAAIVIEEIAEEIAEEIVVDEAVTEELLEEAVIEEAPQEVAEAPAAEEIPVVTEEFSYEEESDFNDDTAAVDAVEEFCDSLSTPAEIIIVEEKSAEPEIAGSDEAVRIINGEIVHIRYRTSFMSRLIQSGKPAQDYYSAVKNFLLSYKGIKARSSWNFESFNKGRTQCAKLNVKGNSLRVYLALDPNEYSESKYRFDNVSEKPGLDRVPMMIKVKSERTLKNTLDLIAQLMSKLDIKQGNIPEVDYSMPSESTEALVDKGLVKVIFPSGIVIDENTVIEKLNVGELMKAMKNSPSDTINIDAVIEQVMAEPDVALEEIDFVDEIDEEYEDTPDHPGLEVVGVVWPERAHKNKIYRYDPNGEKLSDGDIVLVPTRDAAKGKDVIRKAAIAHGNHFIDPEQHPHALKKVICVVKRHTECPDK